MTVSCEELSRLIGTEVAGLIACEPNGDGEFLIYSPLSTIDGSHIEISLKVHPDGSCVVSDVGESLRHLASYGIDFTDSEVRVDYARQVSTRLGVTFSNGRLTLESDSESLASAIFRLVEASRFFTDMVYTARPREEHGPR